ncbi:hypothetical protein D9M69_513540 [compost metagenome]
MEVVSIGVSKNRLWPFTHHEGMPSSAVCSDTLTWLTDTLRRSLVSVWVAMRRSSTASMSALRLLIVWAWPAAASAASRLPAMAMSPPL